MAIINPLAYTIANGDPVDATPVQANLSQIVQDVNANAAPIAGSASQQFLVATTTNPAGAVPLAQAQSQFAAISGSSSQVFSVATAASGSSQAPPIAQTVGAGASGYVNQTANRAIGTAYTNNTGRPLVVAIDAVIAGGINAVIADSSGTLIYGGASNAGTTNRSFAMNAIIPPGASYELFNSTGTINIWLEY